MGLQVTVLYRAASQLARHLRDHLAEGSLLLPLREARLDVQQFQPLTVRLVLPGGDASFAAEVLQLIPALGLAVRIVGDPAALLAIAQGATPDERTDPPLVTVSTGPAPAAPAAGDAATEAEAEAAELTDTKAAAADDDEAQVGKSQGPTTTAEADELAHLMAEDEPADEPATRRRVGVGPLSWPMEKLQVEWHSLSLPDKARLAKYGKRHARGLVIRSQDRTLQPFLICNTGITPEEVAALAGMVNIDLTVLKRIASSTDWLRHTPVVRNLVCHPKATLPQITRLIEYLADDELRRLTRTGKVRASVKQLIMRKLEQRAGRVKRR